MGFPAGASLAFFMASSNFLARMSSLLVSWNHESANLSSRCRCCSCRILEACVKSTSGPFFGGASCESTAPKTESTTSLAWQHGHVTFKLSLPRLLKPALYDAADAQGSAHPCRLKRAQCPRVAPHCRSRRPPVSSLFPPPTKLYENKGLQVSRITTSAKAGGGSADHRSRYVNQKPYHLHNQGHFSQRLTRGPRKLSPRAPQSASICASHPATAEFPGRPCSPANPHRSLLPHSPIQSIPA